MEILKNNLLSTLETKKSSYEHDFIQLAEKTDIRYEDKLTQLIELLHQITTVENSIILVHRYFKVHQKQQQEINQTNYQEQEQNADDI